MVRKSGRNKRKNGREIKEVKSSRGVARALYIKSEVTFRNDNRLGNFRLQGDYLYDKGENDELCYVSQLSHNRFTSIFYHAR